MEMIVLNKVGLGKNFTFSGNVKKKLRINGILRASVPYTENRIAFEEKCTKKGYILKYFKKKTLIEDLKTGEKMEFPGKVLAIVA